MTLAMLLSAPATGTAHAFSANSRAPRRQPVAAAAQQQQPSSRELGTSAAQQAQPLVVGRRQLAALAAAVTAAAVLAPPPAEALGFKKEMKRRKIPEEEYSELPGGLKFYELAVGRGEAVQAGTTVTVHFDCKYRGLDVVSSRSARLLGGNRTLAEPFQFVAGDKASARGTAKRAGETAGGLFSGQSGPKPPVAIAAAVVGMKVGGRRSVLVPPELGYGAQGEQEIPPNTPFELQIELLSRS